MIYQNAFQTPDGTVLFSKCSKNIEYFDTKVNKMYFICGGRSLMFNNIDDRCIPYFITENTSLKDLKSKLLWRTYGKKQWEKREEATYRLLVDLESDHLERILNMSSSHILVKYVIGEILNSRKTLPRLNNVTPNPKP
jgi:hypothetical protein